METTDKIPKAQTVEEKEMDKVKLDKNEVKQLIADKQKQLKTAQIIKK